MTTFEKMSVVTPADWVPGPRQGQWTYETYAAIPEDGHRYEVVKGVLYMAPGPSWPHQNIALEIASVLRRSVRAAGLGAVGIAPFDVELENGTIVQPDVFVLLNEHLDRLTTTRMIGAPDIAIEIASPATAGHDRRRKQDSYAAANTPEYWIVDGATQTIELLVLEAGAYVSYGLFSGTSTLPSKVLPTITLKVEQFFP